MNIEIGIKDIKVLFLTAYYVHVGMYFFLLILEIKSGSFTRDELYKLLTLFVRKCVKNKPKKDVCCYLEKTQSFLNGKYSHNSLNLEVLCEINLINTHNNLQMTVLRPLISF